MANWTETKAAALEILRNAYSLELERIAEELRPQFESGALGGYRGCDTPPGEPYEDRNPLDDLEHEMAKRLVTEEVDEYLVMAITPSMFDDCAREAAALDVLRVALARGWYKPKLDAYPGASDLALPSPREVRP